MYSALGRSPTASFALGSCGDRQEPGLDRVWTRGPNPAQLSGGDSAHRHKPRSCTAGGHHGAAGAEPVRQPRVNDKRVAEETGERKRFSSAIMPAWVRKSPQVAEVLPLLYPHGLSSGDLAPALEQFCGSAGGLSRRRSRG